MFTENQNQNSENVQTPVAGLFDTYVSQSKDEAVKAGLPLKRKRIQRALNAAYDDAAGQQIEAEARLEAARREVNGELFDINKVLRQKEVVKNAIATQEAIAEEYRALFGENLAR